MGESYPTGMYFTRAPTVRLRSESCPLGSRNRAVARTVTMEWPSTRRRFEPTPTGLQKSLSSCCVKGALRRRSSSAWMAKGSEADGSQNGGSGGIGVHLLRRAEYREAVRQPGPRHQARSAAQLRVRHGNVSPVEDIWRNAFHKK
jgi:hypothetical protein